MQFLYVHFSTSFGIWRIMRHHPGIFIVPHRQVVFVKGPIKLIRGFMHIGGTLKKMGGGGISRSFFGTFWFFLEQYCCTYEKTRVTI